MDKRNEFEKDYNHFDNELPRKCANCDREEDLHIHHVVPLSVGGFNRTSNMVRLCYECHGKVHGKNFSNRFLQKEGIEKAKKRGAYLNHGANKKYSPTGTHKEVYFNIVRGLKKGQPISHIARDNDVSRPTIYKIKESL